MRTSNPETVRKYLMEFPHKCSDALLLIRVKETRKILSAAMELEASQVETVHGPMEGV
jgi:hypothetical protein